MEKLTRNETIVILSAIYSKLAVLEDDGKSETDEYKVLRGLRMKFIDSTVIFV